MASLEGRPPHVKRAVLSGDAEAIAAMARAGGRTVSAIAKDEKARIAWEAAHLARVFEDTAYADGRKGLNRVPLPEDED